MWGEAAKRAVWMLIWGKKKKKNSKTSAGDLNPHDREMMLTSASSLQKHWPNQSYSGNVTWLHVPIDTGSILYARYLTLNGCFMRFNLHFFFLNKEVRTRSARGMESVCGLTLTAHTGEVSSLDMNGVKELLWWWWPLRVYSRRYIGRSQLDGLL